MSMSFFSAKCDKKDRPKVFDSKDDPRGADIGVWFAVNPQGPWTGLRSVLPVSTLLKEIGKRHLAVEVSMQQNLKAVKLRSLTIVVNNTDMALDVCLCPYSLLNSDNQQSTAIEEVFENQRYQPLAGGWGSKWPGHLMPNDPCRWSNRDYSIKSQVILRVWQMSRA